MSADDVESQNEAATLWRIHAAGKWPPYADDEVTRRCCVACDLSYDGPVKCPSCGGDGYPGHTAPITRGTGRVRRMGPTPTTGRSPGQGGIRVRFWVSAETYARLEADALAAGMTVSELAYLRATATAPG